MYPTNQQIADTLSPAARLGTALFLAVASFLPGLGWLLFFAAGNAWEAVRQYVERDSLMAD